MKFRSDIILSVVIHVALCSLVLAAVTSGTQSHTIEEYITVFLAKGFNEVESPVSQEEGGHGGGKNIPPVMQKNGGAESPQNRKNNLENNVAPTSDLHQRNEPPQSPEKKDADRAFAAGGSGTSRDPASPVAYGRGEGGTSPPEASSPPSGGGTSGRDGGDRISVTRSEGGGSGELFVKIRTAIERALIYPPLAKKRGIEGTVTAEFMINNRGMPEGIRIIKSSGFTVLDTAARETIIKAAPLPSVTGNIEIPITFRLMRDTK